MEKRLIDRRSSEKYLHIQLSVANILAESLTLNVATQKILKTIGEFFAWEVGEVWAIDNNNNAMICVSHWLSNNNLLKIRPQDFPSKLALGEGIPGLIWKNQSPCWLHNIKAKISTINNQFMDKKDLNSCFGIPILFKKEVLGILLFYSNEVQEVNHNIIVLFTSIGKQIGSFIKRRRIEDELLHLSQHDALTGLANRSILEHRINTEISYALNHKTKTVLLYLDIDYFKQINDDFGHDYGDIILENVAKRLSETVREADTVARLGGDEFAILLVNMGSKAQILKMVEKISAAIRQPYTWDGKEYRITMSIGVSIYPYDGTDAKTLITSADCAMYHSKKNGKNQYQFASLIKSRFTSDRRTKFALVDLQRALSQQEFTLYYQPIAAVQTNAVLGHEALLRWYHPNGKLLNLEEFIYDLEENKLLPDVYQWTVDAIFRQLSLMEEKKTSLGTIHLSLSHITDSLITQISDNLQKYSISPNKFTIGIKENSLLDTKANLILLSTIKKLGINIAVENFGSGVSSINALRNFRIDKLKLDSLFIAGLPDDPNSCAVVLATLVMARSLKISTVAKGVENKAQLNFLKAHDCDEYQGDYLSKPLSKGPNLI